MKYKVVTIYDPRNSYAVLVESSLNEGLAKGWELVTILSHGASCHIVWKIPGVVERTT